MCDCCVSYLRIDNRIKKNNFTLSTIMMIKIIAAIVAEVVIMMIIIILITIIIAILINSNIR